MIVSNSSSKWGKILIVAILSVLVAASLSTAVLNESDGDSDNKCGPNLTWSIIKEGDQYTLTIEGFGSMYTDRYNSKSDLPWNDYRDLISKIVLPDDITSIANHAFEDFTKASGELKIGKLVSTIGEQALKNCKVEKITVDSSNKDFTSVNGVLYDYNKTKIIQVPAGTNLTAYSIPSTVTTINAYAFSGCTIIKLDVSSYVKTMQNAFADLNVSSIVFGKNCTADASGCGMTFYSDESTTTTTIAGHQFDKDDDKMIQTSSDPNTYTVSFENCSTLEGITEIQGFTIILPTTATHVSLNLTFNGWLNANDQPVGKTYTGTTNATLKAEWKVKVTYDTGEGSNVEPSLINPNSTINPPDPDPVHPTLTFEKWMNGLNEIDWTLPIAQNVTYTAVWKVEVEFDSQGGSDVPSKMIDVGAAIGNLHTPEKPGYSFLGWFTGASGGNEVTKTTTFDRSTTIYAQWKSEVFTITFVCEKDGAEITSWEKIVGGGNVITAPSDKTFNYDKTTYYIEGWKDFTDGMIATEDETFYGIYFKAIDIKEAIEGDITYVAGSDAVYILSTSFTKLIEKAKKDPEFTYTIKFTNGSISFDSVFLKGQKAADTKVAIFKLSKDSELVPEIFKKYSSAGDSIFQVIFGNKNTLSSQVTVTLNYGFTEKQVKERLCVYGISEDKSAIINMSGSPSDTGITFKTVNLAYFVLKYDSTSCLIKYMNEGVLFYYYLVEKGQLIPVPVGIPGKEPTVEFKYVFKEWNGYSENMKAFTDRSFNAVYDQERRVYTIKFICEAEGKSIELESKELVYGEKITAPRERSIGIEGKTFEIISWVGLTEESTVTGDATYYAKLQEATSTSWIYIVICIVIVLLVVEGIYLYNKKYRD